MKRLVVGFGLLVSFAACGITDISVDGDIGEQQVPGDILGGILGDVFQPIPLQIDVQAALDAQDLKIIKGVFLDKIVLNITATANQNGDDNFDFIDKIDLFASAPSRSDLPEVLIGSLTHGNDGATTITGGPITVLDEFTPPAQSSYSSQHL